MVEPPRTPEDLIRLVQQSNLIKPDDLNEFLSRNPRAANPATLAKALIQAGLLTAFQAEQLMQGRSRGFDLGNYRILKPLGGGATGMVFHCEHRVMKHQVALKVLSSELVQKDSKTLMRFRREARAASSLMHPNIVRTIDLDEDGDRHYLVMEYVEGINLEDLRKRKGQLSVNDVVGYAIQVLNGLQHISDAGLVHRDIKPQNLLLDNEGTVKIVDLGLARFTDDRQDNITVQQGVAIMGTVDFMAPEQVIDGSSVDHRADIYSLGSTLYYLLTGQSPLPDGPVTSKILASQFQTPKRISALRSEVDEELEEVIAKMMAKDPARRFQTANEAIKAFQRWQKLQPGRMPAPFEKPLAKDAPAAPESAVPATTHSSRDRSTDPKVRAPVAAATKSSGQAGRPTVAATATKTSGINARPPASTVATTRHVPAAPGAPAKNLPVKAGVKAATSPRAEEGGSLPMAEVIDALTDTVPTTELGVGATQAVRSAPKREVAKPLAQSSKLPLIVALLVGLVIGGVLMIALK